MTANPYESPKSKGTSLVLPKVPGRSKANRLLRISLLILLVPAIYNLWCFNFIAIRGSAPIHIFFRAANAFGFLLISLAAWFLSLKLLELLTQILHTIFARHSRLEDWKGALYSILGRAPILVIVGAALWIFWVSSIYIQKADFYAVSVPVGVAGHLVGAGLYLPLFIRWFNLERSSKPVVKT